MSNVADARMPAKSWFHGYNHDNDQGWMQLLLYCLHITDFNRGGPATREATDDDIKRCDADGNPRKRTTG